MTCPVVFDLVLFYSDLHQGQDITCYKGNFRSYLFTPAYTTGPVRPVTKYDSTAVCSQFGADIVTYSLPIHTGRCSNYFAQIAVSNLFFNRVILPRQYDTNSIKLYIVRCQRK